MLLFAFYQFALFVVITGALMLPCGAYIAMIFADEARGLRKLFIPFERLFFWIAGLPALPLPPSGLTDNYVQQDWKQYLSAVLIFNGVGWAVLFLLLMYQDVLPLNPQKLPGLSVPLAFNIAISFVTNTDWQSYSGETTLSYFSQMVGLTVQNFLSAATGFAVAIATIRGFTRREMPLLGNFYVDVTRVTLYLLLPFAFLFAIFLITQGVPDNVLPTVHVTTLDGGTQMVAEGPVASQIAIKMIGSNGGGYFNANAAHPYENPTPLSNLVQLVTIVLLPIAFVFTFGHLVRDRRQAWALFTVMTLLFLILFALCIWGEVTTNPAFEKFGVDQIASDINPGGNMEGKELRFGIFNSALWATATTATSNGSVNSAHDSLMPLGGAVTLFNMLVGEVIFGGVGCGLYGILIYVLITVFIAGLMVGRTPEYLGKKIEAREMKLAVIAQLLYPVSVLGFGMLSLLLPDGAVSVTAEGPHALTQTIYAYASAAANNGSAFAGFNSNTTYQNIALGLVMLIGRFGVIMAILAIAGSLAMKKTVPSSPGTFSTHGLMFIVLLLAVIVMFGGLTYFPVIALGPLAEHLALFSGGGV